MVCHVFMKWSYDLQQFIFNRFFLPQSETWHDVNNHQEETASGVVTRCQCDAAQTPLTAGASLWLHTSLKSRTAEKHHIKLKQCLLSWSSFTSWLVDNVSLRIVEWLRTLKRWPGFRSNMSNQSLKQFDGKTKKSFLRVNSLVQAGCETVTTVLLCDSSVHKTRGSGLLQCRIAWVRTLAWSDVTAIFDNVRCLVHLEFMWI